MDDDTPSGEKPPTDTESSRDLLARSRAGDREALDRLCRRYAPLLRRWATGRLPAWARDALDTDDLVQEALIQSLGTFAFDNFQPRFDGALQAYLRQALVNDIRDKLRRARRRPPTEGLQSDQPDPGGSPLEDAIGHEAANRYEAALQLLKAEEREAVILRVEMGQSYAAIASALGKSSADSARMTVSRALVRLAREMSGHG